MTVKWDRTKGTAEPISALNRIKELENGDPLVAIQEFAPKILIHRDTVIPYLRKRVCEMLHEASIQLPDGLFLGVIDAWRPFARQERIYEWLMKCARESYPDRSYAQLRRTVCRFVAPTDQPAPPGHCTGAAVDVYLLDDQHEMVDVVSPFDRFKAAPTYSFGLTEEAQRNRELLVNTMLSVGFSNCRDEWWHYSYGDAGWAVRAGEPTCCYGIAELDASLYARQEEISERFFKDRPNPFFDTSTAP